MSINNSKLPGIITGAKKKIIMNGLLFHFIVQLLVCSLRLYTKGPFVLKTDTDRALCP